MAPTLPECRYHEAQHSAIDPCAKCYLNVMEWQAPSVGVSWYVSGTIFPPIHGRSFPCEYEAPPLPVGFRRYIAIINGVVRGTDARLTAIAEAQAIEM